MMKSKICIILFCLFSLASCNGWLEVTPKGEMEASDMLSSVKGYNSALGGIYYTLSNTSLYGKELTFGMMDLLAQYWDVSNNSSHSYYKLSKYDYKDVNAISKFKGIWKEFYYAISQCNLIIASLEKNRDDIKYSELMEGGAYGLRALAHMELFRMFGPVIKSDADLDKPAIAYRTELNTEAQKFESGREILAKVNADLTKALELMKDDPIKTIGRRGDLNSSLLDYNEVINKRGSQMNYYGVLGLLARLEQLRLNHAQAYTYAKRVIDETKMTNAIVFTNKMETLTGLNYSCELLLSLFVDNTSIISSTFYMGGEIGSTNNSFGITMGLYTTFTNDIYGRIPDGSGTDNRLRHWFVKSFQDATYYDFMKLNLEVPIMRLSEIYYIACEAQIGKDNDLALSYLNVVRENRNLVKLEGPLGPDELREYLTREVRKEFIGDGRTFLYYKRLFSSIYVKQGLTIAPLDENFVFPIPDDEYEYSPNAKETND